MLYQLIKGLRNSVSSGASDQFSFDLTTAFNTNQYNYQQYRIKSDWINSDDRDEVAKLIFSDPEMNFALNVKSKSEAGHGRILKLRFLSGKTLFVRFDQGVSYWTPGWATNPETINFNFNADFIRQKNRILTMNNEVKGAEHPTQIFLKQDDITP